jgi:hypothetical protein
MGTEGGPFDTQAFLPRKLAAIRKRPSDRHDDGKNDGKYGGRDDIGFPIRKRPSNSHPECQDDDAPVARKKAKGKGKAVHLDVEDDDDSLQEESPFQHDTVVDGCNWYHSARMGTSSSSLSPERIRPECEFLTLAR